MLGVHGHKGFSLLIFFTCDDVNGKPLFSGQRGGKCWDLGFPSVVATVNIWIGGPFVAHLGCCVCFSSQSQGEQRGLGRQRDLVCL